MIQSNFVDNLGLRTTLKVGLIIVILLLLLIPLSLINSLRIEREKRADETIREIIDGVGGHFELIGPVLVIPYKVATEKSVPGERGWINEEFENSGSFSILPDSVQVDGRLEVKQRQRGIYRTPVYRAVITVEGRFTIPENSIFPENSRMQLDKNILIAAIPDMRGIRELSTLQWGETSHSFSPNSSFSPSSSGIAAGSLPLDTPGQSVHFSWNMVVDGGGRIAITPLGRDSTLVLSGDWPAPSFKGSRLPDERQWDDAGFTARWRIPEVSRPIQPYGETETVLASVLIQESDEGDFSAHALKVDLLDTVNAYTKFERSLKYRILFLFVPFLVFFLIEVMGGRRIHPVQYLLVGTVDIVFYLLLLSLAEHLGFDYAYLTASLATGVLMSFYIRSSTGNRLAAPVMPLLLGGVYLWLWFALRSEDYALLIGSIGLFVIVAIVMILTRRIDYWKESNPSAITAPDG